MSSNMSEEEAHNEAKTKNAACVVKNTANQATYKVVAAHATNMSQGEAQVKKEEAVGIIQQTGEQVVNMDQGAYDGAKNTLGVDENQKK